MKKMLSIVLAILILGTLMVGCTNAKDSNAVSKDTVIILATIGTDGLDPISGSMADHTYNHAVFDTLVKYSESGEYLPCLAESWTEAEDSMSITYNLRKDVKFHDGTPFTADDVIYTLDSTLAIPAYGQFWGSIASWEKIDNYRVKINKVTAYTDINSNLALAFMIVPKATRSADMDAFSKNPVGTGAYKFVSKEVDGTVTLIANDEYFGGNPEIKNAIIKAPLDASTAVVALENGEVDVVANVMSSQLPIILKNEKLNLVELSSNAVSTAFLMGDVLKNDNNLRKAIFHGINRQNAIALAAEGMGQEAVGLFSAKTMGDLVDCVDYKGYDEALAKDYLSKSSYDGKPIKIVIMATEVAHAQSIQSDLSKIGINAEIEQLDVNAWSTKVMNGEAEITITSAGGGTIEDSLKMLSTTYPYFGKDMQSTDKYENLMIQMDAEKNTDARKVIVEEGIKIEYDLANIVPMFEPLVNFAHNKAITNISPSSAATRIFYIGDFKLAK